MNLLFLFIDTDDISIATPIVEEENGQNNCLEEEDQIRKRRGNSGVEGKDFHLGSILSRENSKIWYEGRQIARDYRYDKILRNRSIGRQGTGTLQGLDQENYRFREKFYHV